VCPLVSPTQAQLSRMAWKLDLRAFTMVRPDSLGGENKLINAKVLDPFRFLLIVLAS